MPAAISTARLEARISTDLHAMLKRAAELQGCWRRFKSDQACRLNFDQGPTPGFLMPGCG